MSKYIIGQTIDNKEGWLIGTSVNKLGGGLRTVAKSVIGFEPVLVKVQKKWLWLALVVALGFLVEGLVHEVYYALRYWDWYNLGSRLIENEYAGSCAMVFERLVVHTMWMVIWRAWWCKKGSAGMPAFIFKIIIILTWINSKFYFKKIILHILIISNFVILLIIRAL